MNFRKQQEKLIQFISCNYKNYLPDSVPEPEITTEFLDFDKFKGGFTVFADFARIDFRQSAWKDDCGDMEHLSVTLYLVHRNNQASVLNDNNMDSAYAFYEMFRDKPGLGIACNAAIDGIEFFKYAEGTKYLVCSEINLSLDIEIQEEE
jgi:hypothetical protein